MILRLGPEPATKAALGQFMTPSPIATFMASMFGPTGGKTLRLLDPGAGMGALSAAFAKKAREDGAVSLATTAWEIDPDMQRHLLHTLGCVEDECRRAKVSFSFDVQTSDFVIAASKIVASESSPVFSHTILNPPYKKINSKSHHRVALRTAGIETANLYSAFAALAILLLEEGGEMVAITPRSFCNGTYFRPFRRLLVENGALERVHIFDSRTSAFKSDKVLQENVIFKFVKGAAQGAVTISTSTDASLSDLRERIVAFNEVVQPSDPELLLNLVPEADDTFDRVAARFCYSLEDLGLGVATGPVVDFRLKEHLSVEARAESVPLIYPLHFDAGLVRHPKEGARKPNWIMSNADTLKWLRPSGYYTVVRRLSSKEERRRLVPAVFDPERIPSSSVGFENHLNVFHRQNGGLPKKIAYGLAVWLGSTVADEWLRRFNGHTQVNAGDLRALRYPDIETLSAWGRSAESALPSQDDIDAMVNYALTNGRTTPLFRRASST